MSLKISKTIEISQRKIGRNERCPCGSGKKYKKCCLRKEEQYTPSVHKGQTSRLVDWATEQPFFLDILKARLKEIFGANKIEELEFNGLMEALIFEEKINGKTILEHFVQKAPLSKEEKAIYQPWLEKSFFSIFEALDVNVGKSLRLKDLISNKEYLVLERLGTYQINKGAIIPCRLLPFKEQLWTLGGGLGMILSNEESDEISYFIKRNFKNLPFSNLSEMDFIKAWLGKKKEKHEIKNLSHRKTKKLLAELLKEKKVPYQISDFEAMILKEKGYKQDVHTQAIQEFSKVAKDEEELNEWTEIFYHYWSSHPKFKKGKLSPGPKEQNLINQVFLEAQKENFTQYSPRKANRLVNKFSQKWLNIPQEELNNKSPREIILAERRERGNPNKELSYHFSLTPLNLPHPEKEFSRKYNLATRLLAKEHRYLSALKLFTEITPEIEFLGKEKFRWYGKMGSCLAGLGEIDLAKKYFQKSLELNPDYDISQKNLRNLESIEDIKAFKKSGQQQLFLGVLEEQPVFQIKKTENCELRCDLVAFLNYLSQNKAPISEKQKIIRFKDVLAINKNLARPDLESLKIDKVINPRSSEWQMPKVHFLHHLAQAGELIKEEKKTLLLTPAGKTFLTKSYQEQFSLAFATWINKLDWPDFECANDRFRMSEPMAQALQMQSWSIFKAIKECKGQIFSKKEFLTSILDVPKEDVAKELLSLFLDKLILDYLIWMGIIRGEKKSKFAQDLGLPSAELSPSYDEFSVTQFGLALVNALENKMANIIPKSCFIDYSDPRDQVGKENVASNIPRKSGMDEGCISG